MCVTECGTRAPGDGLALYRNCDPTAVTWGTRTDGRIPITVRGVINLVYLHHLVYLGGHVPLIGHIKLKGLVANVAIMAIDRFDPTPIYLQIAAMIIERIKRGDLEPRDPIPSENQMVMEFGIGRETARHVVAHLREQGWAFTLARRGTYVSSREQWPSGE